MDPKIISNKHPRFFVCRADVPAHVLASDFDWLNEDEGADYFFKYRGGWYHLSEFTRNSSLTAFSGEGGRTEDGAFSAVVIRVAVDCETLVCGLAVS